MLQNLHPRVQMFPRSRKAAVPAFQHSFRFGQAALSQTVCRPPALMRFLTLMNDRLVANGTLNQGGRRCAVLSEDIGRILCAQEPAFSCSAALIT
jgi:hypothetical protein